MNDPSRSSDEELADSLSASDDHAIAALAGRYARPLYDFALRATLDPAVAAAATRSTIEYLRLQAPSRPRDMSLRAWLFAHAQEQVLAVAGDRARGPDAKLSPGDRRFTEAGPGIDRDVALWAWQAARSLRPRDYCLLDLTLRRGIAPEDVAGAAQGRGGAYGALGRARGGFDEAYIATALYFRGRDACPDLAELVGGSGASMRVGIRRQIASHVEGCAICQATLESLPSAAQVFSELEDVELPPGLPDQVLAGLPSMASAGQMALDDVAQLEEEPGGAGEEFVAADVAAEGPVTEEQMWAREREPDLAVAPEYAEAEPVFTGVIDSEEPYDLGAPVPLERRHTGVEFGRAYRGRGVRALLAPLTSGLLWSYVWLGVSTAVAIYLGIAAADSLRGGGGAAGEVELGTGGVRNIPCATGPLTLNHGTTQVFQFDPAALDGFEIDSVLVSSDTGAGRNGLTANARNGSGLELQAARVQSNTARLDEFLVQIEWQRGDEGGRSNCSVVVNVTPSNAP